MDKIKLSDLRNGSIDWQQLSKTLKKLISNDLLVNGSDYEVVRECVRHVNFRKVPTDIVTVRKQAAKVLKITVLRRSIIESDKVFKHFITILLRYKELPSLYKKIIEAEVRKDFLKLNDLVIYYQEKSFIKLYEAEGAIPRNHEDRTLLVFYKRALDKREQVIQFIYNKIDELSLRAARQTFYPDFVLENEAMDTMHSYTYYPYRDGFFNNKFVHGIDYEVLDHRLINPFRNKLFIHGISSKIDAGYTHNELNTILLKLKPISYIDYVLTTTDLLPGIFKRKEVFEELKYLFSKKKWYSLYALALPQIEGLFSDIINIAFPGKSVGGTLTDKVDSVRPLYSLSGKFFDYYQYYLPTQRNRFAHVGYDIDIISKAYHCVFDLWFLINTFYNLDLPLLEIIRIVNEGKPYFEHIGKLAKFVHLIKKVSQAKGFMDKEKSIKLFFNELFSSLIDLDNLLHLLQADFDEAFLVFSENFSDMAYLWTKENISFKSMSKGELHAKKEYIKITLEKGVFPVDDDIKLLVDTNSFIRNTRLIFKDISASITSKTDAFYSHNKNILDKIDLITPGQGVDFEISDHFMFFGRKEWKHTKALI